MSPPAFRKVSVQVDPEPEEIVPEEPEQVCWELALSFHRLLVEVPAVWLPSGTLLLSLGLCWSCVGRRLRFKSLATKVASPVNSLAEQGIEMAQEVALTKDGAMQGELQAPLLETDAGGEGPVVMEEAFSGWGDSVMHEQEVHLGTCQVACELGQGSMGALVGGTEVGVTDPHVAEHRTELAQEVELAGEEALLNCLRALLLDTHAGGKGPDSWPLMEVVARAVVTREVIIREMEGGTEAGVADSHVIREVVTKEVVTRELVIQAVLQDAGPLRSPEQGL